MFALIATALVLATGLLWLPGLLRPVVVVAKGMRCRRNSAGDWINLATAGLGGLLLVGLDCGLLTILWA